MVSLLTRHAEVHVCPDGGGAAATFGFSGCWGVDRTVVAVNERGALITPHNKSYETPGSACTAVIASIPHRITLTFTTPGEKTITVLARDFETGANRPVDVTVTVNQ